MSVRTIALVAVHTLISCNTLESACCVYQFQCVKELGALFDSVHVWTHSSAANS